MENGIRAGVKEHIMPPPTIAWARTSYAPSGDVDTQTSGITRIGIGATLYDLREAEDHSVFLTTRQVVEDPSSTRIYIGNLGSSPSIKITASPDKPFALEDPERINAAAEIARKLAETDAAFTTSLQIEKEGIKFLQQLKHFIPQTDQNTLGKIGVLDDELTKYVNQDYPSEFLTIADEIEQLGIAEIVLNPLDKHQGNNVTASFLRKTYGKTAENREAA